MTYTPPEGVTIGSFAADTLPASFSAPADAAISYKIYGTSAGAGVETGNLFDGEWQVGYWAASDGQHRESTHWVCSLNKFPCVAGSAYSFKYFANSRYYSIGWYDSNGTYISMDSEQNSDDTGYRLFTAVAPNNAAYMSISIGSYPGEFDLIDPSTAATLTLVQGSTVPTSHIPYGYKIPISLTDGTSASNYDLFVGGSKLYADEYLDFDSQKVYKYVDGVLTPQDPPLPFPAISTYKGENTLSSTETLGDIELTGDWLAIMGSTEDESIDIDFTVDAEEYIALVSVDDGPSIQVSDTITMPSSASSFTLQVVSWGREQYTDTVYNALS